MSTAALDTVIIPAAGLGTRVKQLTGAGFKEALRVHDRTLLEWALHDAERSQVARAIIVLSPAKLALAEQLGTRRGQLVIDYAWQSQPRGLAHALLLGYRLAPAPAVIAYLPDNVALAGEPICAQLRAAYQRFPGYVLGLLRIARSELVRFGSAGFVDSQPIDADHVRITRIHDKQSFVAEEPVVLKGFPASVFPRAFFDRAQALCTREHLGEIDDTPIIQEAARAGAAIGRVLHTTVFDCGRPEGFAAALAHRLA
ncbi:MAG: sugar phosphate nucleotidyltransferase [Planctomycetota bacterium]